jgi:DNA-binding MarR family transcriptional regulator
VKPARDAIDDLIEQWKVQRPDLRQPEVMGLFGRYARIWAHATRAIEANLAQWGLQIGEFDVLATIRRAGPPFTITPSQLTKWLMLSPSGITSRLDRLEKLGLIERKPSPDDRRSLLVILTAEGKRVADEAVASHLANEIRLVSPLGAADRQALDRALRVLLRSFETPDA